MEAKSTIAAPQGVARIPPLNYSISEVVAHYWLLTKPDINLLIAIAVFVGFCLARPITSQSFPYLLLIHALLGTLLVASGTGSLNQFMERNFDAQMRRTARRPVVVGAIAPGSALLFGVVVSLGGILYLGIAVNWLSSMIASGALVAYLALYTPLKRITPMCTFVGAVPGAVPPLIGWAAASGRLGAEAWTLYLILFLWQFPHFMAIAWMYREDYDRAGYVVLPRCKRRHNFVALQSLLPTLLLVPISLIPTLAGDAGRNYLSGALLLDLGFLYFAVRQVLSRSNVVARQLLFASIIYLPSVLFFILLDKK